MNTNKNPAQYWTIIYFQLPYQDKSSYELPAELAFKQQRLETIQQAKEVLEAREKSLSSDKEIDDKKQISFADHDARIMGKKGAFDVTVHVP